LSELKVAPGAIAEVLHGTTVGSNTILQRKGARTGLITTRGFRDVLEIGRIRMPDMFDLTWEKPKPLVARRHRLEVGERMAADGSPVEPLSETSVIDAARALVADGIEAVAIAFINSYRNPAHELQAEAVLRANFPQLLVTTSCAVLPEMKEYERTSTTVVNAYLLAAMRSYLQKLESGLRSIGVAAPILVMTSNGGMLAANVTCDKPVLVVASGPAGGVIGAARLGIARDDRDVIVFDMGGTTAKAVIIEDGRPSMTSEYEFRDGISTSSRFIKAGGYMLKVPAIDIAEVGAGGGSIAAIDKGGLLTVGPQSAGAMPGPACYGLGNDRPTVTDANVVLGFINPSALAGGKLGIDRSLSETAIRRHVGDPLALSLDDAAHGIRAVANAAMARAVRAVTVERGRDPRDLTLMAFGGNGGVHAPDLARLLGIPRVVVPPMSGIFSALGMLASDIEHTALKTVGRRLDRMSVADLRDIKAGLQRQVAAQLAADGYLSDRTAFLWEADLRHEGQASELTVPFEGEDLAQVLRWCAPRLSVRASAAAITVSATSIMLRRSSQSTSTGSNVAAEVAGWSPSSSRNSDTARAAERNPVSVRNGPTSADMIACNCRTSVATLGCSRRVARDSRSSAGRAARGLHRIVCRAALCAALAPARAPNTRASVMALPDSRLAPLAPPTASPQA
jgi:N-methylhydantoinase A